MAVKRFLITKTKFIPPLLKESTVHRPHLMKKLHQVYHYPLTLIHSGPGYGKSTVLSAFLSAQTKPYCWYSLSKQEDDFIPFLVHMIYAVQSRFPYFGEKIVDYLQNEERANLEEDIEFLCSEYINELFTIQEDFIFVIDDIHIIEHSSQTKKWLISFISHLPSHVHLVLSGRIRLHWDIITKMLVRGNLLELSEAELAFTKEEIEVLFSHSYGCELESEQVDKIYQLTEGWIIAIQMIWQQMKIRGGLDGYQGENPASNEELLRFLTMEVFVNQPEEVQLFLLKTAIFDEFHVKLCYDLYQWKDTNEMLQYLLDQNLFIVQIGEGLYRYHPLFRDFLLKRLRKNEPFFYRVHRQAADYYCKSGQFEKAIYHYQEIGEEEKIAYILQYNGQQLLSEGKIETLSEVLDKLSMEVKNKFEMLWFLEGELNRYFCKYERALTCYSQLEELAQEKRDRYLESFGKEGKARIYLDTIQPAKADGYLSKAIERMGQSEGNAEREIQLYSLMAENLLNLGKAQEAEKWLEKCKELQANFKKVELESRLYLRTGRLLEAKKLLEHAQFEEEGQNHSSRSHRETDLLLSIIFSYTGEGERAKRLAEKGIFRGAARKAPFVEACGWMRLGHAVQLLERYEPNLAAKCYETSIDLMEQINMSRGKSEAYMGLCLLFGKLTDYQKAYQYGQMALEEPSRVKDLWLTTYITLALGINAFYNRRWEESEFYFMKCKENFEECGDKYGYIVTLFWLAYLYDALKEKRTFKQYIKEFLTLIKHHHYEFFIENHTLFGPADIETIVPLLLAAKELNVKEDYVSSLLRRLGYKELGFHPGYTIRVQTLGDFQVWIGNEKLSEKSWKREKAKELFQLLITKRDKMISKSEILELLWKEQEEEAAQRDFKVALNALNRAIEPNRKARANTFFIVREGTFYGLNKEASFEIDAVRFEKLIEEGLEESNRRLAIEKLSRGLEYYQGDYLSGSRYDDWCLEERERLLLLYLRGAERLAQMFVAEERFDEAIRWCESILTHDPCWEEAYRLLMYCYYRKQNRSYALRLFEKCQKHLQQELGVEPMESTKKMFAMIKDVPFLPL